MSIAMFSSWNWVDFVFAGFVVFGLLHGLFRGLSKILGNLAGLLVAILGTRLLYIPIGDWLAHRTGWPEELSRLVAVLLLGIGIWLLVRLILMGLGALMSFSFKGWVERLGGMLAGALWYGGLVLVVMWALTFIQSATLQRAILIDSVVGSAAMPFLQEAYNALAEKASLSKSTIPIGVEAEPRAILPPGAEEWMQETADRAGDYWDDEIEPRFRQQD